MFSELFCLNALGLVERCLNPIKPTVLWLFDQMSIIPENGRLFGVKVSPTTPEPEISNPDHNASTIKTNDIVWVLLEVGDARNHC